MRLSRGYIAMCITAAVLVVPALADEVEGTSKTFERLKYNHPDLVVDLGVGLWAQPLPMDYDGDGDYDMVVSTRNKPSNGTYFFENTQGDAKYPTFKAAVRIDEGLKNVTVSYVNDSALVMTPGHRYPDFLASGSAKPEEMSYESGLSIERVRAEQWKLADYDGDGRMDLVLGVSSWSDYGWDDAFSEKGEWTAGPLHGWVFIALNTGTNKAPVYGAPERVLAGGEPVDVYGCPSPNIADFDGDGDLDLVCGEFLDKLTYFQNKGTRSAPEYAEGRYLTDGKERIHMDLEMLQVVALDWDKDGDTDLIVGQEDGRVALVEHTGRMAKNMPIFLAPRFFQQEADDVKIGALCTPFGVDWDGDDDEDLIAGDTAGYLNFVENLDNADPPQWAAPVYLKADGVVIRIQAGPNGSIQGPAEAKWGYTVPNVADWNHDGLPDIIINSIWGEVLWYENAGTRTTPKLRAAQRIEVAWNGAPPKPAWTWWQPKGNQLVTQWRTSPLVRDLNGDGLNDLIMLDHEGYLAFFERRRTDDVLELLPGKRIFLDENRQALRLSEKRAGGSGRRKLVMTDWDGDGRLDILINSLNIDFMRNIAEEEGEFVFKNLGNLSEQRLAGHTTCPAIVDWNRDGVPDLIAGAEDGFLYYFKNLRTQD